MSNIVFSASWQIGQVVFVCCFHSFCLYRLYNRKSFSPVLLVIQFLLVLDILEVTVSKPHNILCEVYREEIFPWYYRDLIVFVTLFRWYSILTMLPFVGVLTILSLVYPLFYMHLSRTRTIKYIVVASCFPLGLIIPQYLSCCGFIFYIPGYYFSFDNTKDSYVYFSTLNWVLQGFCLAFSCLSDLYLMSFVYKNRRIDKRSIVVAASSNNATNTGSLRSNQRQKNRLSPNTRLALSFVIFSGGFVLGTVSYNFLSRLTPSTLITVLKLVFNQSNYVKFGAYAFLPKG